jgi:DNA-directed RNA polymerase subunit M/transcription elongation factor TFIIS
MPEKTCPKCGTKMECKFWLPQDEYGGGGYAIFQCPKCKNIEVKD